MFARNDLKLPFCKSCVGKSCLDPSNNEEADGSHLDFVPEDHGFGPPLNFVDLCVDIHCFFLVLVINASIVAATNAFIGAATIAIYFQP